MSMLSRLTPEAHKRLRKVCQNSMLQNGIPKEFVFSSIGERQADMMIEVFGERTAEDLIRRGMDCGLIERTVSNR